MTVNADTVLWVCALVSMLLAAFSVPTGRVNTFYLAFVFAILTILV